MSKSKTISKTQKFTITRARINSESETPPRYANKTIEKDVILMGYKTKPSILKRQTQLNLRYTKTEKATIQSHAADAGLSIPDYVIALDGNKPILPSEIKVILKSMQKELSAQGNNFNQIARQLNRHAAHTSDKQIMKDLKKTEGKRLAIMKKIYELLENPRKTIQ